MDSENKVMVRRVFQEGWNEGSVAVFDQVIAKHYINHDSSALPSIKPNLEGLKQQVAVYRAAFADLHIAIDDLIEDHDKVVARYTITGTHTGDLLGIAPTSHKISANGITIYLIQAGKIVESWTNWDALSLMHVDLWEVLETIILIQRHGRQ